MAECKMAKRYPQWTVFYRHGCVFIGTAPYYVLVEAPQPIAIKVFFNRYGGHPFEARCSICGPTYKIRNEQETAQLFSAVKRGEVKHAMITKDQITDQDRNVVLPAL
jgi:hypothetical protein